MTIKELAISREELFTEDQFQLLIEALDDSAVEKLWMINDCRKKFHATSLSKKVKIEWYPSHKNLFKKW